MSIIKTTMLCASGMQARLSDSRGFSFEPPMYSMLTPLGFYISFGIFRLGLQSNLDTACADVRSVLQI